VSSANKLICLLFYYLLVTEVFPQGVSYMSINGNINNSFLTRSIYNISYSNPLIKNKTAGILDSLIYISTYGDSNKIAYYYNDDLSLNYFTYAARYNNGWIDLDKHTNIYNSDGNLESVLWESFNTSLNVWVKDAKDVYNYDSLGNRIFHLHQYFNGHDFVNLFKTDNYFEGTNLISSVNQHWVDSVWVKSSKMINIINSDNLKDTTLFQDWKNNQWVNYQMNIYEYDEKFNIISNLAKRWQEDNLLNFGMGTFEYDINNNCVLENWEIAINNNWENWFRIFYEYDNSNNLIHLFGEEWENGHWVPENELLLVTNPDGILYGYLAKEIFLFYSNPTIVRSENNLTNGFNLFQNFPNPFNPTTTISYSIKEKGFVQLKVHDVLGKEILTLINEEKPQGKYSVKFNGNNLPSGVYFYTLRVNNYVQSRKMVLLR